jgi:hypothetical protein
MPQCIQVSTAHGCADWSTAGLLVTANKCGDARAAVAVLQVWQATVVYKQCGSLKPWVSHPWNCFELLRYACWTDNPTAAVQYPSGQAKTHANGTTTGIKPCSNCGCSGKTC